MAERIVVGYDDKEPAKRALERAIDEAKARKAEIVVVSVVEMPLNPEGPQNFGSLDDTPARMIPLVLPADLEPVIAHARERIEAEGVRSDFFWAAGDPAANIVDVAREQNASLVVLGEHHHSVFGRVFGTDVAAEVKRRLGAELVVVD